VWLKVTEHGSKSWILRYTFEGRERWTGLGPYPIVSLADAREKALSVKKQVHQGTDPIQHKREVRALAEAEAEAEQASIVTFDWCAEQYIAAHRGGWKNPKHADQWVNTLQTYASPVIGALAVEKVDTDLVMKVLQPIWTTKAETASRLRGRLQSVLDWAVVKNLRTGENPARWKGHLDNLLPKKSKVARTQHHPALDWKEIGPFMSALTAQPGIGALALQFTILTAARSGEVRGMTWDEVNLDAGVWVVPGERMKANREHRVPLSPSAIAILEQLKPLRRGVKEVVFPGVRDRKPLSDMTLTAVLRRMDRKDLTVHGFRSTFRDWAAEGTDYPAEMAEMALAHTISSKVEAAYRRGNMFEKRQAMMNDWAKLCTGLPA
jgi:integrase